MYTSLIKSSQANIRSFQARAVTETQMASALSSPPATGKGIHYRFFILRLSLIHSSGSGFGADDGASLLMTFRGLQAEAVSQGQAHLNIAKELESLVADPFDQWAQGYKVCALFKLRYCSSQDASFTCLGPSQTK